LKVLLANPMTRESITKEGRVIIPLDVTFEPYRFPLSLCLAAAAIRRECPDAAVRVVDGPAEGVGHPGFAALLAALRPDLTIVNVASPTLELDLAVARSAAAIGSRVALFGQHAQAFAAHLLRSAPEADCCVVGEPEPTLAELAAAIAAGRPLSTVPGLVHRDAAGAHARSAERPALESIDALSWPARDLVDSDRYRLPDGERYTLILAGRGCPFDCPFCLAPGLHGRRARLRRPQALVEELRTVVRETPIRSFLFQADLFTANRAWVLELCELLIRSAPPVRWICNTRVDTLDEEMLRRMRRAGLFMISFGLESGDPRMLEILGKGRVGVERIRAVVECCRELGIKSNGSFVVGHPGETRESLARTRELILSLPLDMAVLMCSTPHPGTPLFDRLAATRSFLSDDFEDYSFNRYVIGGTGLDPGEVQAYIRSLRRDFYFSPGYARRRLADLREPLRFFRSAGFALQRLSYGGVRALGERRRGRGEAGVLEPVAARINPRARRSAPSRPHAEGVGAERGS